MNICMFVIISQYILYPVLSVLYLDEGMLSNCVTAMACRKSVSWPGHVVKLCHDQGMS